MKNEIRIFFTALMFLTRLPVPHYTDHSHEYLQKAVKYFPLAGWIVAAISGLAFFVFNRYISEDIAIAASIIAGILTTGAFHEDGFADTCDAFGGGWTKEKILMIMKDSRLGSYGVIGMIAILGVKFLLLTSIPKFDSFYIILIAAHAISRLMPIIIMQRLDYVTDNDGSKSKPIATRKPSAGEFLLAAAFALVPFTLLSWYFLLTIIPVLMVAFYLARYFKKWIGGYTGDCMGAIQQVSELTFYLGTIIVWRYLI